jgi:hypothetical protein
MANQIIFAATITPTTAAMEVSINTGTSFTPATFATVGSNQQYTMTGVAAATYAAGQLIMRAVGYPASAASNAGSVIVSAAAAAETTFSDAFPATTSRWTDTSTGTGKSTANNGVSLQQGLSISNQGDANKAQYGSVLAYDLRGRSLTINIAGIGNPNDATQAGFVFSVGSKARTSASNIALVVQTNVLYGQFGDAHGTFGQIAYNATTQKYLRLSVTADGLNFTAAYSADNVTYTTLNTQALGGVSMAAAYITLTTMQSGGATLTAPTVITSATLA